MDDPTGGGVREFENGAGVKIVAGEGDEVAAVGQKREGGNGASEAAGDC
jgi:hypothetical protein